MTDDDGRLDRGRFDESKSSLFHVVPRAGDGKGYSVEAPSAVLMQIANAHETPDGAIVVDAIEMPRLPFGPNAAPGTPWQESFDMARDVPPARLVRWTVSEKGATRQILSPAFQAFPAVNPYVTSVRHSYIYTAAAASGGAEEGTAAPLQRVLKTDVSGGGKGGEWQPPAGQFLGEPVYVPKTTGQSEDDGYILVQVYDATQRFLVDVDRED
ncbi:carotenoid oxygenase [Baffinella frigidus]|nr:carotenoid oxygenase [Cryptophyta sp. CCMP2293]